MLLADTWTENIYTSRTALAIRFAGWSKSTRCTFGGRESHSSLHIFAIGFVLVPHIRCADKGAF